MLTPELQKYVSDSRAAGLSDDQIRKNLISQGWQAGDINQALGSAPVVLASSGSHLFKIIGISLVAVAALAVTSYFINLKFQFFKLPFGNPVTPASAPATSAGDFKLPTCQDTLKYFSNDKIGQIFGEPFESSDAVKYLNGANGSPDTGGFGFGSCQFQADSNSYKVLTLMALDYQIEMPTKSEAIQVAKSAFETNKDKYPNSIEGAGAAPCDGIAWGAPSGQDLAASGYKRSVIFLVSADTSGHPEYFSNTNAQAFKDLILDACSKAP